MKEIKNKKLLTVVYLSGLLILIGLSFILTRWHDLGYWTSVFFIFLGWTSVFISSSLLDNINSKIFSANITLIPISLIYFIAVFLEILAFEIVFSASYQTFVVVQSVSFLIYFGFFVYFYRIKKDINNIKLVISSDNLSFYESLIYRYERIHRKVKKVNPTIYKQLNYLMYKTGENITYSDPHINESIAYLDHDLEILINQVERELYRLIETYDTNTLVIIDLLDKINNLINDRNYQNKILN